MKKYCLTQCAKNKLAKGKAFMVDVASASMALFVVLAGGTVMLLAIGLIVDMLVGIGWFPSPDEPFKNLMESGAAGIIAMMIIGLLIFVMYKLYKVFSMAGRSVMLRFDPNAETCHLFEECIDEKEQL